MGHKRGVKPGTRNALKGSGRRVQRYIGLDPEVEPVAAAMVDARRQDDPRASLSDVVNDLLRAANHQK